MADIKPIETHYNGYRFRSRLEARWAVFFDKMNVKYEYEPEGYTFNDGSSYLPDFYLPTVNAFVEIKHKEYFHFKQEDNDFEFWADDKDISYKYANAINNLVDNDHVFLLLCGDPYDVIENSLNKEKEGKGVIFHMDSCLIQELIRHKKLKISDVRCGNGKCKGLKCKPNLFSCNDFLGFDKNGFFIIGVDFDDSRIPLPFNVFNIIPCGEHAKINNLESGVSEEELCKNQSAALIARKARFEHGECG